VQGLQHPARAFFVPKFKKTWLVNNALTNATAVTIGILDDTAGVQVVPPGTVMPNALDHTGTPIVGKYEFPIPAYLREHAYTVTIVVSYGGRQYTSSETAPATVHGEETPGPSRLAESHDLSAAIAANAASAESVQSAAGSVKAHPLTDQIAADQYLASKRAAQRGRPGIRIFHREGNTSG
jgi:hypothetical protein